MGRNHEVTERHPLLDGNGELVEPGWSRSLVQEYDRKMIKAPKFRIKEWDYYLVMGQGFAGAFTISDDGYIGLQSVSLLELGDEPWEHTETVLNTFPMGRIGLPADSSSGVTKYHDKRLNMKFEAGDGKRCIRCKFDRFWKDKPFKCDITLEQPDMESGSGSGTDIGIIFTTIFTNIKKGGYYVRFNYPFPFNMLKEVYHL